MLANIDLHYVLDLWFEKRFKPQCRGEAYLVRFVDDFVVSFQYLADATKASPISRLVASAMTS